MSTPGTALKTRIAAAGYGTADVNIYEGDERPSDPSTGVPRECVFCRESGGPPPDSYMNGRTSHVFYQDVQIIVRGEIDDLEGVMVKARGIRVAVCNTVPSGFLDCGALQSGPVNMGENDAKEPRVAVNVRMVSEEP